MGSDGQFRKTELGHHTPLTERQKVRDGGGCEEIKFFKNQLLMMTTGCQHCAVIKDGESEMGNDTAYIIFLV